LSLMEDGTIQLVLRKRGVLHWCLVV
jgi:hypothetical protein